MAIDIVTPTFPESIQEGTIAKWHKLPGEAVARDQVLVDVETDKVVIEVVAPADGSLLEILKGEQAVVHTGEVLAKFVEGAASAGQGATTASVAEPPAAGGVSGGTGGGGVAGPAARRLAAERGVDLARVSGSGRDGRITKEDVLNYQAPAEAPRAVTVPSTVAPSTVAPSAAIPSAAIPSAAAPEPAPVAGGVPQSGTRLERRVPMSRMRARIAERLLEVTQTTAMLTTFNEVDMHRVMDVRAQYKDEFARVHNGVRLGLMSFFVKAAVEALKRFPQVNASIDGNDIIYHGYQDIGVAVSTERGLVVPILRDADHLSMAEIESRIADYGERARIGKLSMEEMTGGTFTITNGGVFGSLVSTPILNPPQAAILGMHTIKDRPVVENGAIVIRPMMYLALSYDHRLIDGRDAVRFLVAIKEMIEYPAKILLQI
ncbi:MAG TPA: 2-oxoglutarate dehydrogenase complex dihydrolipoyllysine-residue succinyltransferase [Porticoccaceae bacterium]|nr:2-oxoglutarate dehydrogenase complex dihydrolipoyllysine-residue succinyltransferase [Porticoccaceae bacterium]